MVAVEVGQHHALDPLRVHAEAPQGDQRGRPAVHQDAPAGGGQVDARLEAAAAPERVARPEEADGEAHGRYDIVPGMSATTRLAEFVVKTSLEDVPPAAVGLVRRAALDTLGVTLAAWPAPRAAPRSPPSSAPAS